MESLVRDASKSPLLVPQETGLPLCERDRSTVFSLFYHRHWGTSSSQEYFG